MTSLSFLFPGKNTVSFLLFLGDMIFIPFTSSDAVAEVREEGGKLGKTGVIAGQVSVSL